MNVGRFHYLLHLDWQHQAVQDNVTQLVVRLLGEYDEFRRHGQLQIDRDGECISAQCRVRAVPDEPGTCTSAARASSSCASSQFAYNLPRSVIAPARAAASRRHRIQLEGRNLLVITHYPGLDPEASNFGNQNVGRNIDLSEYPPSRTVWLGINLGL